jgi:hypothetical protein
MDRNLPCPCLVELASNFAITLEEMTIKGKAQQRTSESNHPKKEKKNRIQHMDSY